MTREERQRKISLRVLPPWEKLGSLADTGADRSTSSPRASVSSSAFLRLRRNELNLMRSGIPTSPLVDEVDVAGMDWAMKTRSITKDEPWSNADRKRRFEERGK